MHSNVTAYCQAECSNYLYLKWEGEVQHSIGFETLSRKK